MAKVSIVTINNTGAEGFEVTDPESGNKYASFNDVNEAFDYCGDTGRVVVGFRGYPFGDGLDPLVLIEMFDFVSKQMYPSKVLFKLFARIAKEIFLKERAEQLYKIALSENNNPNEGEKTK